MVGARYLRPGPGNPAPATKLPVVCTAPSTSLRTFGKVSGTPLHLEGARFLEDPAQRGAPEPGSFAPALSATSGACGQPANDHDPKVKKTRS
jgi:hypothetical protein